MHRSGFFFKCQFYYHPITFLKHFSSISSEDDCRGLSPEADEHVASSWRIWWQIWLPWNVLTTCTDKLCHQGRFCLHLTVGKNLTRCENFDHIAKFARMAKFDPGEKFYRRANLMLKNDGWLTRGLNLTAVQKCATRAFTTWAEFETLATFSHGQNFHMGKICIWAKFETLAKFSYGQNLHRIYIGKVCILGKIWPRTKFSLG